MPLGRYEPLLATRVRPTGGIYHLGIGDRLTGIQACQTDVISRSGPRRVGEGVRHVGSECRSPMEEFSAS
jgi:hypothetical protein